MNHKLDSVKESLHNLYTWSTNMLFIVGFIAGFIVSFFLSDVIKNKVVELKDKVMGLLK